MRPSDMPSAGFLPNGATLTREVMKAINAAQVQHDISGGASEVPAQLRAFFAECMKHLPKAAKKTTTD